METIEILDNHVIVAENEPDFVQNTNEEVSANYIILCEETDNSVLQKNIYEYSICGASVLSFVVRACSTRPMILKCNTDDVLSLIRPYAKGADYTVVLYANTPLIVGQHLKDLLAFVHNRNMQSCKLKRGFIFNNDYIQRVDDIYSTIVYDFGGNDFFEVNNLSDLAEAKKILSQKIIEFHHSKGVLFEDEQAVLCFASAEIGYGTIVSSGAQIKDNTKIGTECKISANAVIEGSKIADYSGIGKGTIIENSIIKTGARIGSGVIIKNSIIGQNAIVGDGCILSDTSLKDNSSLGDKCYVKNSMIKENTLIEDCVTLLNARIGENVKIGSASAVLGDADAVIVSDGTEIVTGSTINLAFDEVSSAGDGE